MSERALTRLRVGMIAPEFPPDIGGMHTLARGFADALSETCDVTVYTPKGRPPFAGEYRQRAILTGRLRPDSYILSAESLDVWLGMNAGLLPILSRLPGPAFAYIHGKDFLTPWISYGPWWLDTVRRPQLPRFRKWVRRRSLVAHRNGPRKYFTNSRQTAELAVERLRIGPNDIQVCPPGVDERFFQAKEPCSNQRLRLMTVSRLTRFTRRKNIDGVLEAVASLRRELPLEYVVVGDGDDRARLETMAEDLGVTDIVTFAGALSPEQLTKTYRSADLFVLASKATTLDFEGFGIVYLEACASGVPVLCSAEGGATDAVEDGTNGILVPDSSPATIAAGIRRFVAERSRFREDDIRAWAARFRWPLVARQLDSAMRAALP